MMDQLGPCGPSSQWLHAFIVVINAFQAIGVAYVVQRAARKNREERRTNGHSTE